MLTDGQVSHQGRARRHCQEQEAQVIVHGAGKRGLALWESERIFWEVLLCVYHQTHAMELGVLHSFVFSILLG